MIKKFFALMMVCTFALNAVGMAFAAPDVKKSAAQTGQLAALLPASDAVMTLDMRRLVGDALPQILAGNQPILAAIVGKIDEIKNKTGFDLRQFEQVAVGVSSRQTARELDFQPVVLARGALNANALIALGKIAANGKYREEKIGDRSIYVFSPQQLTQDPNFRTTPLPPQKSSASNSSAAPSAAKKTPSVFERAMNRMFDSLSREVAVAAFDDNTLAIGTPMRVRESFGANSARVGADVLNLVNRRPNAVAAFGFKVPNGLSEIIPNLGNDEIGKNIDAIRYLAGSFDVNDGSAAVSVMAKTLAPEQAINLHEQIEGLQSLGKIFIGGGKGADKQVFARMIDNLKIARAANEVTLDLQIPQSDISILISKKK